MTRKTLVILLEILALCLVIGGINILFPSDPGFAAIYYTPYLIAGILVSAVYGAGWGFLTFILSAAIVSGGLPLVVYIIHGQDYIDDYWSSLKTTVYIPASIGLALIYIFGVIRSTARTTINSLKNRTKDLAKDNWLLNKKSEALFKVNLELDERVSRQQEAITSLYTQLRKLDTLDLNQALEVLLETVQIFTKAMKASIWRYDDSIKSLRLAASVGWEPDEKIATMIPVDGSIEGWVYRNNSLFSVRMLLQYDNLAKMDSGRNIITIPLSLERRIWGIVNIQEMPFEKYNLYSERILQIIASLAEHSIERAVAYESIIQKEEVDDRTGLPLFSQFYRMLEEESRSSGVQKGSFSVVLLELINFSVIHEEHGLENAKAIIKDVAEALKSISDRNATCFQYKSDAQIALLIPSLDLDGVQLFSLEVLERINAEDWEIRGDPVRLEAVIGFSVFTGESESPDQVLEQAEALLEMQKFLV